MRKAFALIFVITTLVFCQSGIQLKSVRSSGMGDVSVAFADDAYGAVNNPAGLFQLNRMHLYSSYTKFFSGLDVGSISEGNFFFAPHPLKKNTYALAGSYFFHDIYSGMKLSLSYARKLMVFGEDEGFLGIGLTGDLYRVGYNLDNALYDEEHGDNPNDPLFIPGTDKLAFGGDFSAFARLREATFGLKVSDINEPNISIEGVTAGALPRRVRAGFSYEYQDFLVGGLDLDVPIRSATLQDPMKLGLGIEGRVFEKKLFLRTGYEMKIGEGSNGSMHFGLGFRTRTKHNIGFDYALTIPGGEVTSNIHHRFAVVYGFPVPPAKQIDLVVYPDSFTNQPDIFRPDSLGIIRAVIANIGEDAAKRFYVKVYYYTEDSVYGFIEKRKIDGLEMDQSLELEFTWIPPVKGFYMVYVSVDDIAEKEGDREGVHPDLNPQNNRAGFKVPVFNPPSMDKDPSFLKSMLKLSEINYIREEVPLAPFVFFAQGDTLVPERFFETMQIYADRLKRNPNIGFNIKGYIDGPTESNLSIHKELLAQARARQVKIYLKNLGVAEKQLLNIDPSDYDFTQPRAGKRNRNRAGYYEDKVAAENRRTEIGSQILDFPDSILICCVNYRVGEIEIPPEGKIEVESSMRLTKELLDNNRDIIILFHGMSTEEDGADWERAFDRGVNVRNYAGQLVSRQTVNKMMVFASAPDTADMVAIVMSGDAVAYRPKGSARAAQGFQVAARERNEVKLGEITCDAGVDSYYIAIVDEFLDEFKYLAAGHGFPPAAIPWDWHGNEGEPPEPNKEYFARMYIKDNVGQILDVKSEPVKIKVTREEKRQELILVNFTFGGTFPQSPYLEGRMERIASDFIEKAVQRKTVFKVIVGGHTDIIGTPEVNQRLSLNRAKRESRNLRRMLISLLRIKGDTELDIWLAEHNVSIDVKGFGYSKPYKIRVWDRGYFRDILMGDNEYPEGRFVNRRVALEYEIIKHYK